MSRSLLVLLLLACAGSGCTARYYQSRGLDFMDAIPVSAGAGLGLSAEARVTPFLGLGLGYANSWRAGTDEQRFGPIWWEKERGIPLWRYYRHQNYRDGGSRWPGGNEHFFVLHRHRASSLLVVPGMVREGMFWFPWLPPYFTPADWEWNDTSLVDLLNVEAGVFLGVVGLRAGVSVVQLVDFVLGIFTIDIASDDVRTRPMQWPDVGAGAPSFPEETVPPEEPAPDPAATPGATPP